MYVSTNKDGVHSRLREIQNHITRSIKYIMNIIPNKTPHFEQQKPQCRVINKHFEKAISFLICTKREGRTNHLALFAWPGWGGWRKWAMPWELEISNEVLIEKLSWLFWHSVQWYRGMSWTFSYFNDKPKLMQLPVLLSLWTTKLLVNITRLTCALFFLF